MDLHALDLSLIALYLAAVLAFGVVMRRKARVSLESYFLGSRKVPWYLLGISNASSMFDIAGTMWLVSVVFIYGAKGAWLPWLWPTYNQVFLMVYLSQWVRRSGALTGADWMTTRFKNAVGLEMARMVLVVFALLSVVSFSAYAFKGLAGFASIFLPDTLEPTTYAFLLISISLLYATLGGIRSVIFTDIVQFALLIAISVVIGYYAMVFTSAESIAAVTPEGWGSVWFGRELDLDWSGLLPQLNDIIQLQGYELFFPFFMMMMFKGVLVSVAGPAPNFDMQRLLATRNPREAALMSSLVSLALFPRWILVTGIVVLGLVYYSSDLRLQDPAFDYELVLPHVVSEFVPIGLKGLIIVGFLAAFMSTFDSTINAGAAYLVNDVYKRYLRPNQSPESYVKLCYLASILVVALGVGISIFMDSINDIMGWIVGGLWGGYAAPNILKWHWWRFNGVGYFCGMLGGIASSVSLPELFPQYSFIQLFPAVFLISLVAAVVGSLCSRHEDMDTLCSFYRKVHPWGLWGPVIEEVRKRKPEIEANKDWPRHIFNIVVGIVWHFMLVITPLFLVIREFKSMWICVGIFLFTSCVLKRSWLDPLNREKDPS
ncbi:Na+:solute symporter [Pelagicoccus enzymogenes]|uniref:sodium:solute symporter family protein n=1 Tax=Pelagicoccus enzymogenes TaxID=2773457 RepID=UPI002810511B|nr:sodium:solute symporter family protein [Pelagicoccus enzymogenes]MDQ8197484.1 Na+:solute symporter [Pelagicoccus enzymogenes]